MRSARLNLIRVLCFAQRLDSSLLQYRNYPLCSPLSGSRPSMSSLSCGEARDSRTGLTATPSIRHLGSRTPRSSAHVYPLQRSRPLERPISPFWLHPRFPEHISALLRSCLYELNPTNLNNLLLHRSWRRSVKSTSFHDCGFARHRVQMLMSFTDKHVKR